MGLEIKNNNCAHNNLITGKILKTYCSINVPTTRKYNNDLSQKLNNYEVQDKHLSEQLSDNWNNDKMMKISDCLKDLSQWHLIPLLSTTRYNKSLVYQVVLVMLWHHGERSYHCFKTSCINVIVSICRLQKTTTSRLFQNCCCHAFWPQCRRCNVV